MFEKLKFELDVMKVRYHILMMEQFWMKPSTHWYKWRMPFRVMGLDIYLWQRTANRYGTLSRGEICGSLFLSLKEMLGCV